jgi:cellulose synthase/poly-beta-1,6-N-acetylglucosamine synthase-like glycosyltransferase
MLSLLITIISIVLCAQSLFSLYLMLYTWEHPERLESSSGPKTFVPPHHSFTVLLPARHEEAVIHDTIMRVWRANYPTDLLEIVVICHADDTGTIAEARRAIQMIGAPQVRVESFADAPINKPHGLNVGLQRTSHEIVTIFDSEDDIDSDIFNVVNTVMCQEQVGIVQAGVQLMNHRDHWFSMHNCLEYYFWFKSRLHFHAQVGMIPLGGNTVFIRRDLLARVGGWDEECLTEDAEIGLRLSVLGQPIRVIYDAQHVTREETPDTVESFIKQRTRWHQGFLQVLRKGVWRSLPQINQRLLAIYTLSYPLFQALLMLLWPLTIIAVLWFKLSALVAILSFLPLYALLFQFLATVVGAFMFTRDYRLRFPLLLPFSMAASFLPFQLLLGISALRAVYRELRNQQNWEKTAHIGAHRQQVPSRLNPALQWEALFDEVNQYLGAERASVMSWNPVTNSFALTASRGLAPEAPGARMDTGSGVVGWVAEHRRPVTINGHTLPAELQRRLTQPKLQSAIVVPVEQNDMIVTVVSVSSSLTELGEDAMRWLDNRITQMIHNQGSATGRLIPRAGDLRPVFGE